MYIHPSCLFLQILSNKTMCSNFGLFTKYYLITLNSRRKALLKQSSHRNIKQVISLLNFSKNEIVFAQFGILNYDSINYGHRI